MTLTSTNKLKILYHSDMHFNTEDDIEVFVLSLPPETNYDIVIFDGDITITEAVSKGAVEAGNLLGAKAILVWTKSGRAARMVRKYGPIVPIIALTDNDQTARQLSLTRGVTAFVEKNLDKTDEFFTRAMELVGTLPKNRKGDIVVLVTGISETGTTNTFKVGIVGE